MTDPATRLLTAFELHSVEGIRAALDAGADLRTPIRDKLPIDWLTEMYTRSDRFPACLRLLLERGATLRDPVVAPVLLDDGAALAAMLRSEPARLVHRTDMISAFTPLIGASLLHVAAEYCNAKAARVLIEAGAEVDARAALDAHGLNGHTPLFHCVNSHANRGEAVLRLLLAAGARPDLRIAGITWGAGFDWATTCFDLTPISYAQLGLLPQMHRAERDIYANIARLLEAAGRDLPPLDNVPNRYLQPDKEGKH
jgi:hypothetical protein